MLPQILSAGSTRDVQNSKKHKTSKPTNNKSHNKLCALESIIASVSSQIDELEKMTHWDMSRSISAPHFHIPQTNRQTHSRQSNLSGAQLFTEDLEEDVHVSYFPTLARAQTTNYLLKRDLQSASSHNQDQTLILSRSVSRSSNRNRKGTSPTVKQHFFQSQEELESEERNVTAFLESFKRTKLQEPSTLKIQVWWKMTIKRAKFRSWQKSRRRFMLRYLDNWKRHSRLQKISRIAPLRRMFMTWKEEVEESKASKEMMLKLRRSGLATGQVFSNDIMNVSEKKDGKDDKDGKDRSLDDIKAMAQRKLQLRIFRIWFEYTRMHRIKRSQAEKRLQRVARMGQESLRRYQVRSVRIWPGELCVLGFHLWHRYTVFKKHKRLSLPTPQFQDAMPQWNTWIAMYHTRQAIKVKVNEMGPKAIKRHWFYHWHKIMDVLADKRQRTAKARHHYHLNLCSRIMRELRWIVRQRGKVMRVCRNIIVVWKTWSDERIRIRESGEETKKRVKERNMQQFFNNWRNTFQMRSLMNGFATERLLEPSYRFIGLKAVNCWKSQEQLAKLNVWGQWKEFVQRNELWNKYQFVLKRSHARRLLHAVFLALRINVIEQSDPNHAATLAKRLSLQFRLTLWDTVDADDHLHDDLARFSLPQKGKFSWNSPLPHPQRRIEMCHFREAREGSTRILRKLPPSIRCLHFLRYGGIIEDGEDEVRMMKLVNSRSQNQYERHEKSLVLPPIYVAVNSFDPDLHGQVRENWDIDSSVTQEGDTALHLACDMCDFSTVRKLLLAGANPNSVNNIGQTPLHLASSHCSDSYVGLICLLLQFGADPTIKDKEHRTSESLICNPLIKLLILRHALRIQSGDFTDKERRIYRELCLREWDGLSSVSIWRAIVKLMVAKNKYQNRLTYLLFKSPISNPEQNEESFEKIRLQEARAFFASQRAIEEEQVQLILNELETKVQIRQEEMQKQIERDYSLLANSALRESIKRFNTVSSIRRKALHLSSSQHEEQNPIVKNREAKIKIGLNEFVDPIRTNIFIEDVDVHVRMITNKSNIEQEMLEIKNENGYTESHEESDAFKLPLVSASFTNKLLYNLHFILSTCTDDPQQNVMNIDVKVPYQAPLTKRRESLANMDEFKTNEEKTLGSMDDIAKMGVSLIEAVQEEKNRLMTRVAHVEYHINRVRSKEQQLSQEIKSLSIRTAHETTALIASGKVLKSEENKDLSAAGNTDFVQSLTNKSHWSVVQILHNEQELVRKELENEKKIASDLIHRLKEINDVVHNVDNFLEQTQNIVEQCQSFVASYTSQNSQKTRRQSLLYVNAVSVPCHEYTQMPSYCVFFPEYRIHMNNSHVLSTHIGESQNMQEKAVLIAERKQSILQRRNSRRYSEARMRSDRSSLLVKQNTESRSRDLSRALELPNNLGTIDDKRNVHNTRSRNDSITSDQSRSDSDAGENSPVDRKRRGRRKRRTSILGLEVHFEHEESGEENVHSDDSQGSQNSENQSQESDPDTYESFDDPLRPHGFSLMDADMVDKYAHISEKQRLELFKNEYQMSLELIFKAQRDQIEELKKKKKKEEEERLAHDPLAGFVWAQNSNPEDKENEDQNGDENSDNEEESEQESEEEDRNTEEKEIESVENVKEQESTLKADAVSNEDKRHTDQNAQNVSLVDTKIPEHETKDIDTASQQKNDELTQSDGWEESPKQFFQEEKRNFPKVLLRSFEFGNFGVGRLPSTSTQEHPHETTISTNKQKEELVLTPLAKRPSTSFEPIYSTKYETKTDRHNVMWSIRQTSHPTTLGDKTSNSNLAHVAKTSWTSFDHPSTVPIFSVKDLPRSEREIAMKSLQKHQSSKTHSQPIEAPVTNSSEVFDGNKENFIESTEVDIKEPKAQSLESLESPKNKESTIHDKHHDNTQIETIKTNEGSSDDLHNHLMSKETKNESTADREQPDHDVVALSEQNVPINSKDHTESDNFDIIDIHDHNKAMNHSSMVPDHSSIDWDKLFTISNEGKGDQAHAPSAEKLKDLQYSGRHLKKGRKANKQSTQESALESIKDSGPLQEKKVHFDRQTDTQKMEEIKIEIESAKNCTIKKNSPNPKQKKSSPTTPLKHLGMSSPPKSSNKSTLSLSIPESFTEYHGHTKNSARDKNAYDPRMDSSQTAKDTTKPLKNNAIGNNLSLAQDGYNHTQSRMSKRVAVAPPATSIQFYNSEVAKAIHKPKTVKNFYSCYKEKAQLAPLSVVKTRDEDIVEDEGNEGNEGLSVVGRSSDKTSAGLAATGFVVSNRIELVSKLRQSLESARSARLPRKKLGKPKDLTVQPFVHYFPHIKPALSKSQTAPILPTEQNTQSPLHKNIVQRSTDTENNSNLVPNYEPMDSVIHTTSTPLLARPTPNTSAGIRQTRSFNRSSQHSHSKYYRQDGRKTASHLDKASNGVSNIENLSTFVGSMPDASTRAAYAVLYPHLFDSISGWEPTEGELEVLLEYSANSNLYRMFSSAENVLEYETKESEFTTSHDQSTHKQDENGEDDSEESTVGSQKPMSVTVKAPRTRSNLSGLASRGKLSESGLAARILGLVNKTNESGSVESQSKLEQEAMEYSEKSTCQSINPVNQIKVLGRENKPTSTQVQHSVESKDELQVDPVENPKNLTEIGLHEIIQTKQNIDQELLRSAEQKTKEMNKGRAIMQPSGQKSKEMYNENVFQVIECEAGYEEREKDVEIIPSDVIHNPSDTLISYSNNGLQEIASNQTEEIARSELSSNNKQTEKNQIYASTSNSTFDPNTDQTRVLSKEQDLAPIDQTRVLLKEQDLAPIDRNSIKQTASAIQLEDTYVNKNREPCDLNTNVQTVMQDQLNQLSPWDKNEDERLVANIEKDWPQSLDVHINDDLSKEEESAEKQIYQVEKLEKLEKLEKTITCEEKSSPIPKQSENHELQFIHTDNQDFECNPTIQQVPKKNPWDSFKADKDRDDFNRRLKNFVRNYAPIIARLQEEEEGMKGNYDNSSENWVSLTNPDDIDRVNRKFQARRRNFEESHD